MIDWNAIAAPPKAVPDIMRAASALMHRETDPQRMSYFGRTFDNQDKYYFSTSEAHALDRRTK
jgi:hypothetical protein